MSPSATTIPANTDFSSGIPDTAHFTNVTYAALILTFLGAPITQNNIDNLTSWFPWENGTSTWTGTAGANNPLNNGLGSGGGSGLGSYPDLVTSAYYAAKGMQGGIQNAAPIGAALKADAPFSVFHQATINAVWSGDHYAGSGWRNVTSASTPTAVSAADSAKNGASGPVATSSAATQAIIQKELAAEGNAAFGSGNFWQNIGNSLNTLTGGVPGDVANAVSATADWASGLGKLLSDVTSASWWLRVGMGALGIALFGIGLAGFISTTKPGQQSKSSDTTGAVKGAAKDAAVAAVVA